MSDPINTTSGLALDGLTRLEILQELRQQAWLALNENAAQGGINAPRMGDYILDLSDAIDKRINENAEKVKANAVAGVSPFVTAKVTNAGPFAMREEYTPETGDGLLGQIIDKPTGYTIVSTEK